MTPIFVDRHYFIASIQETVQWDDRVVLIENDIEGHPLVTTDTLGSSY